MGTLTHLKPNNKHTLGIYVNLKTKQVFPVSSLDIKKYQDVIMSKVATKKPGTSSVAKEMIRYGTQNFTYRTIACTEDETIMKEWKRVIRDYVASRGMYSFTYNSIEGLMGKLVQLTRKTSASLKTDCEGI